MRAKVAVAAVVFGLSTPSLARPELQCNKKQTQCVTDANDLTIGDRVGIFNDDGELVAVGEVQKMRGERRALLINKRHGAIRQGYQLSLLNSQSSDASYGSSMKVYREPGKLAVGASLGYATVSIGDGAPATEVSGYAQWRKWGGLLLVGRGVFNMLECTVNVDTDEGYERRPISATEFGLLGGVGYTLRETKPLSFRGEIGAGMMYVDANIDGDSDAVNEEGSRAQLRNGFVPAGRWTLGVVWNKGDWHVHGDFAQTLVHKAMAHTLAFGVSRDIK